jgi:hypothetical protein
MQGPFGPNEFRVGFTISVDSDVRILNLMGIALNF